jgi:hypothetical protein
LRFLWASPATIRVQIIKQFFKRYVFAARDRRFSSRNGFEFARFRIHDRYSAYGSDDVLPDRRTQEGSPAEIFSTTYAIECRHFVWRERRRDGLFRAVEHLQVPVS